MQLNGSKCTKFKMKYTLLDYNFQFFVIYWVYWSMVARKNDI